MLFRSGRFFFFFFFFYHLRHLGLSGKEPRAMQETQAAWVRFLDQDNLEKEWHPTPIFFPEKSYEQRSLVGYSPWGRRELGIAE